MALRMLKPRLATIDTSIARPLPPPEKERAHHYGTPEHREWSRQVINRAGGMCQGRGCGRTNTRLYADHIIELKDGGAPLDLRNGQALCGSCHVRKTAKARRARAASP